MFHLNKISSLKSNSRKLILGMIGIVLLAVFLAVCKPTPPPLTTEVAIPVYPGAEGFGTLTAAGRGGEVIVVSNLNDSGPGSLRQALMGPRARIVVFEVGGVIQLDSPLSIDAPYLTIAGQTAPSPGITLKGAGVIISTHDVILQHIRIRPGDSPNGPDPDSRDALTILGPTVFNVVVDHISASWAIDENISTHAPLHGVTISNSIISEGLNDSLHSKGPHSCGFLIGGQSKNIFLKGNLFAHNASRNPRIMGAASVLFVNNVIYDAKSPFMSIGSDSGPSWVSVVGNVFIDGPSTQGAYNAIKVEGTASAGTVVYQADNLSNDGLLKNSTSFDPTVAFPPLWFSPMTLHNSRDVEDVVIRHAGARPMDRDAVDQRVINNLRTRSGRLIDSPESIEDWPTKKSFRPFVIPADAHGDDDNDGYTNIEELLHKMSINLGGV